MNRNRKSSKRRRQTIQVWTHAQAQAALPYVASVVRSLREHALEAQGHRLTLKRLAKQPGRPNRAALIAHEETVRDAEAAEERFQDALGELQELDIYCLDPMRGEALIPFVHEEQLAWFVYDLFDDEPLRTWRYHSDSLETRRPLTAAQRSLVEGPQVA